MATLLALCPLIVGIPGYDVPSGEEGVRVWVWRRLWKSGRGGVTEAVRVFEHVAKSNAVGESRAIEFVRRNANSNSLSNASAQTPVDRGRGRSSVELLSDKGNHLDTGVNVMA